MLQRPAAEVGFDDRVLSEFSFVRVACFIRRSPV